MSYRTMRLPDSVRVLRRFLAFRPGLVWAYAGTTSSGTTPCS